VRRSEHQSETGISQPSARSGQRERGLRTWPIGRPRAGSPPDFRLATEQSLDGSLRSRSQRRPLPSRRGYPVRAPQHATPRRRRPDRAAHRGARARAPVLRDGRREMHDRPRVPSRRGRRHLHRRARQRSRPAPHRRPHPLSAGAARSATTARRTSAGRPSRRGPHVPAAQPARPGRVPRLERREPLARTPPSLTRPSVPNDQARASPKGATGQPTQPHGCEISTTVRSAADQMAPPARRRSRHQASARHPSPGLRVAAAPQCRYPLCYSQKRQRQDPARWPAVPPPRWDAPGYRLMHEHRA